MRAPLLELSDKIEEDCILDGVNVGGGYGVEVKVRGEMVIVCVVEIVIEGDIHQCDNGFPYGFFTQGISDDLQAVNELKRNIEVI